MFDININQKIFEYMFPIAGQTAGPIGLKFCVNTQGWPGGDIGYKKIPKSFFFWKFFFKFFFFSKIFFFQNFFFRKFFFFEIFFFQNLFFHGQRRALQLVYNKTEEKKKSSVSKAIMK